MARVCAISVLVLVLGLVFTGCSFSVPSAVQAKQKETARAKQKAEPAADIAQAEPKETVAIDQDVLEKAEAAGPGKAAIAEEKTPEQTTATAEQKIMEEITGLVIEETMTRIGYEFYEHFFILWEPPEGIQDYNIFIRERASPLWGSWITIEVDSTIPWNRVLRPRSAEIEEAAKEAVRYMERYLARYEQYKAQLEQEEMSGTGI